MESGCLWTNQDFMVHVSQGSRSSLESCHGSLSQWPTFENSLGGWQIFKIWKHVKNFNFYSVVRNGWVRMRNGDLVGFFWMGFVSYISFMETFPPLALLDHLKCKSKVLKKTPWKVKSYILSLFVPLGRGDSWVSLLEIISDALKTDKVQWF